MYGEYTPIYTQTHIDTIHPFQTTENDGDEHQDEEEESTKNEINQKSSVSGSGYICVADM